MIEVMKSVPGVKSFFSTRLDGFSQSPYDSLNVAFHVGDKNADVLKNHQYIQSFFHNTSHISYMDQIHSDRVCEMGTLADIPSCDALVSDKSNSILMVMVADCIPILLYDHKKKIIACVHAGRAGVFNNILTQTVSLMKQKHGSLPENIFVSIGPHIHHCCYEIGKDIADEALRLGYQESITIKDDKFYLNLLSILLSQLVDLGIEKKMLEIIDECTCCNTSKYFSYRKEGQTGRLCGVIMLE